jgi:signal peptidase I
MHKSAVKESSISKSALCPDEADCQFVYHGASMGPTFKPGQLLHIRLDSKKIMPGDIIVFKGQPDSQRIVHRVVSVSAQGFLTRGDNNKGLDPYLVLADQVIGKVDRMEMQGEQKVVLGGRQGLWKAQIRWAMLWLDMWFRRMFWRPYGLLRASRIVPRIWRPVITVVQLKTEEGSLVKYIYKRRAVAVWDPSNRRFECRKPFDLVIPSPLDKESIS